MNKYGGINGDGGVDSLLFIVRYVIERMNPLLRVNFSDY